MKLIYLLCFFLSIQAFAISELENGTCWYEVRESSVIKLVSFPDQEAIELSPLGLKKVQSIVENESEVFLDDVSQYSLEYFCHSNGRRLRLGAKSENKRICIDFKKNGNRHFERGEVYSHDFKSGESSKCIPIIPGEILLFTGYGNELTLEKLILNSSLEKEIGSIERGRGYLKLVLQTEFWFQEYQFVAKFDDEHEVRKNIIDYSYNQVYHHIGSWVTIENSRD